MLGIGMPGGFELAIMALIGLLIFGSRLPSIARSVGSSIVEFKNGMKGLKDDVNEVKGELEDVKREITK